MLATLMASNAFSGNLFRAASAQRAEGVSDARAQCGLSQAVVAAAERPDECSRSKAKEQ
jgi:hypothetical protein